MWISKRRAAFLWVLSVAWIALGVDAAWTMWDCHQHGGCYRMTRDQFAQHIKTAVRVTLEQCR